MVVMEVMTNTALTPRCHIKLRSVEDTMESDSAVSIMLRTFLINDISTKSKPYAKTGLKNLVTLSL